MSYYGERPGGSNFPTSAIYGQICCFRWQFPFKVGSDSVADVAEGFFSFINRAIVLGFSHLLYILSPHTMATTLSYSRSEDFALFSTRISEEYQLADTANDYQPSLALPRSLAYEPVVSYAASFMDQQDSSDSSSGSASPFEDSLMYLPSDEFEISPTGGLTHHSLFGQ